MSQQVQAVSERLFKSDKEEVASLKRHRRTDRLTAFCMGIVSGGSGMLIYEAINDLHDKHESFIADCVVATPYLAIISGILAVRGIIHAKSARQSTQAIHELESKIEVEGAEDLPQRAFLSTGLTSIMPEDSLLYRQYQLKLEPQPGSSENA